jgi:hypothetical protein
MKHFTLFLALSLLFSLVAGCGNNPFGTVKVSGTVTLDGKPIDGVTVMFLPTAEWAMQSSGQTVADGSFVLSTSGAEFGGGAQPGEYNVTFTKAEAEQDASAAPAPSLDDVIDGKVPQSGLYQPPKMIFIVPSKYGNPATSGIAPVKVEKGGKNHFEFRLSTQ